MDPFITFIETQSWFGIVTAVITLASAIVAATPTPKEGSPFSKVYTFIEFLALNIGKAKDTGKK
jgi:hypothetical protein